MGAEQFLEGLGFSLAELREAHGGMSHGAVMLAQLRACFSVHRCRGIAISSKS